MFDPDTPTETDPHHYVFSLPDSGPAPKDGPVFEMVGPFETADAADAWVEEEGYGRHTTYRIEQVVEPIEPGPLVRVQRMSPDVTPSPGP